MRLLTLTAGVAGLLAPTVDGRIARVGIPAVIRPGDTFNATLEVPIEQPRDFSMLWGVTVYDNTTQPAMLPQRGILGNIIGSYQMSQFADGKWREYLPLSIEPGSGTGQAVVQMLSTQAFGVNNYVIVAGWWWNVTIGTETSSDLVWAMSDIVWQLYGKN